MIRNFIICGLLLIVVTTQSSCLKKQNLEQTELGAPIDPASVEQSMSDGIGNLNFSDVKTNEINNVVAVSTFEDAQTVKVFNQTLLVDNIVDKPDKLTINLNYSKQYYQSSNYSFSNISYPIEVSKNLDTTLSNFAQSYAENKSASDRPLFLFRVYAYLALSACREQKVTCHNLKVSDLQMILNPQLASPSICNDSSNCVIPVRQIEFDLLDKAQNENTPMRSHYKLTVSKKLPFFSKVLSYCVRGLIDINNHKVLAEDCFNVNNFSAGTD